MPQINLPLSEQELLSLAESVKKIVLDVGEFLANAPISKVTAKNAGSANFVTDLDLTVQNMLVEKLIPLVPGAIFVLEESDELPDAPDFAWVIDPIDGTKNFINPYMESCISVGLVYPNTGVVGMVYNPFRNELFSGVVGHGAYLNGEPIHTSDVELAEAIVCLGTSAYYPHLYQRTADCMGKLYPVTADFRRAGSAALELCYLACGRLDAFIEYQLCAWDYAAATTIIREAGGIIDSIEPNGLDLTKHSGIVAAAPNVFDGFQEVVRNV